MIGRRGVLAAGVACGFAGLAHAQSGWITLLDGTSMTGWTPTGEANWRVAEGTVMADQGSGLLVSEASYGDFELRAEVWVDAEVNSGIFIRCQDPKAISPNNSYELNIWDKRPDPSYGTGAIVNVAKVSSAARSAGLWNVLEASAKGPRLAVVFNGVPTAQGDDGKYARGPIALQHGGSGVVKFRKVQVRPL